jgi:hypothetical protein
MVVINLDFFPAQLIADSRQATLVGVADEGRRGSTALIGPDLSLILVPRDESPIVPPWSNDVTMQHEFVSSMRWVASIVERAEQERSGSTELCVRLSYVSTGKLLKRQEDPELPQSHPKERQTGFALAPRVQVSGEAWSRAEFANFRRAAKRLSYVSQKIKRHGTGAFKTSSGFTTFIFSRTERVRDSGREVVMPSAPSQVGRRSPGPR